MKFLKQANWCEEAKLRKGFKKKYKILIHKYLSKWKILCYFALSNI